MSAEEGVEEGAFDACLKREREGEGEEEVVRKSCEEVHALVVAGVGVVGDASSSQVH
jgi:hypothetical protein